MGPCKVLAGQIPPLSLLVPVGVSPPHCYLAVVFPEGFGQDMSWDMGLDDARGCHGLQLLRACRRFAPGALPPPVRSPPSTKPGPHSAPPATPLPGTIFPGAANSSMGTRLLMASCLHFSGSQPFRIMSTISLTQVVPGEERSGTRLAPFPLEPHLEHQRGPISLASPQV